jgi:glycosyltransferase involved in cell wall biosynthesis
MPYFSVIIPLYNKEKHIKNTVESVLAQSFDDFEIVVVDDGSTDNGLEIINSLKDKRLKVFPKKNQGAAQARNSAIEKASSENIALLDADDIWQPNRLEELHNSIQKFPEASLFCNAYNLKLDDGFTHKATYNIPETDQIQIIDDYFKASIIHPIAWTSAVGFKKTDFNEIGGFDPKVLSGQDIDLWIKFALQKTIVFNPEVTTCYNKTIDNSLSKGNYRKSKCDLFNSYRQEEKKNPSLKKYLDLNRYSLAIQCKYFNDGEVLKKLKNQIDLNSLNSKQKLLLSLPNFMTGQLKKFQSFLIKNDIYLTAFK